MKRCATCQRDYPDHLEACPEDGARLQLPSPWSTGALVRGKYEILEPLGEDYVSVVYKARDLSLGERRAIRVLRPEFAARASLVRQFKHQAAIARRLQHPAIVGVEAAEDDEDGRPFLVMEYVEGPDLGTALPLNAARACSIARQVAGALDVAHRLGLVHRNLGSANIRLLAAPGGERVKVLGFGMARVIESCLHDFHSSEGNLAPTGLIIGTPQYASPEQAAGKLDADLDARSDLYSLGVLLYEMLTGRLPFPSSPSGPSGDDERDLASLVAHLELAPEPLDGALLDGAPQVPGPLAALVEKLLQKKRELRPATAQAVIEELDAIGKDLAPPALEADWELDGRLMTPVITPPGLVTAPAGPPSASGSETLPASPVAGPLAGAARALDEIAGPAVGPLGDELIGTAVESMGPVFERPATAPVLANSVGPVGEAPLSAAPPAPEAASLADLEISERVRPYSTLFKPPEPPSRWPRVLKVGAVLAAIPLAVWCFVVYRPRLARSTINELVERYGPAQNPAAPQPKAHQPPAPISPSGQPGQSGATATSSPPGPQSSNPAASGATEPGPAKPQSLPAIPPPVAQSPPAPAPLARAGSAGSAKTGGVSAPSPARVTRPAPKGSVDPSLVQASVAEGDGFFELGDYDRAIAVYEGPLKIDPAIKVLQQRVGRAKKAKAAEEKYLNQ